MKTQLINCHMHSVLCGHATATIEEMVAAAVRADLHGIIFTEHLPLPGSLDPHRGVSMRPEDLSVYVETLHRLRIQTPQLRLVIGGESDWLNHDPDWTARSVRAARLAGVEVVLGSVHMLDGWAFDNPEDLIAWETREVEEVWGQYFTQWIAAVRSGLFDVMSHADLVKKFGLYPRDRRLYYAEAAQAAGEAGVLCEVSTAGLRYPAGELYPAPCFIELLRDAGVEFTLSTDAHSTRQIDYGLDQAAATLLSLGIERVALPLGGGDIRWFSLH
jgi:histidinol-phosphatase (PHP family)